MQKDVSVPSHDAQTESGDHRLWQTGTENRGGVYEPEYLAEMYVSLEYSIWRYCIYAKV